MICQIMCLSLVNITLLIQQAEVHMCKVFSFYCFDLMVNSVLQSCQHQIPMTADRGAYMQHFPINWYKWYDEKCVWVLLTSPSFYSKQRCTCKSFSFNCFDFMAISQLQSCQHQIPMTADRGACMQHSQINWYKWYA